MCALCHIPQRSTLQRHLRRQGPSALSTTDSFSRTIDLNSGPDRLGTPRRPEAASQSLAGPRSPGF
ncbi:MAG: hypothetical protein ACFB5Z_07120 [Elainellaceae cyanobacterium]